MNPSMIVNNTESKNNDDDLHHQNIDNNNELKLRHTYALKKKEFSNRLFEEDDVEEEEEEAETKDLKTKNEANSVEEDYGSGSDEDLEKVDQVNFDDTKDLKKISNNTNQVTSGPFFYKTKLVISNVIKLGILHAMALYALIFVLPIIQWKTHVFNTILMIFMSLGVEAGAHRFWAHRSFKANIGVRIFFAFCNTLTLQNDIYEWCRDHRAHHKFTETDADPHNSRRGFFFAHVGWLMMRKHPEVLRRGKTIDLSDLEADKVVMFQRNFYKPLLLLIWGFLPVFIPFYFWNESMYLTFFNCIILRSVYVLNITWLVNSWSHLYGSKPYDKRIAPVECTVRHLMMGGGFHNYHHVFPWDYCASELGPANVYNPVAGVIDFFHYMGWVWDLKRASPEMISHRMKTKGDPNVVHTPKNAFIEWVGGLLVTFTPLVLIKFLLMTLMK